MDQLSVAFNNGPGISFWLSTSSEKRLPTDVGELWTLALNPVRGILSISLPNAGRYFFL